MTALNSSRFAAVAAGIPAAVIVIILLTLPLNSAAGQPRPGEATAADRDSVLAVTQRLFDGMRERDEAILREVIHPRAQFYAHQSESGSATIRSGEEFIALVLRSQVPLIERVFDPRVEIEDGVASMWTYYDFYRADQFSHCGVDAFHFVREDGRWKLLAATYTSRRSGCRPEPPPGAGERTEEDADG